MIDVYNQLKIVIEDALKAIDLSYNNSNSCRIKLKEYLNMRFNNVRK